MTDTTFSQGTIIEPTWLQDANDHVNDKTGIKHAASKISNTPSGNISATTVQAAIDELESEKQPLSATLTTLSSATAAGLALMDDADAAAQRTTLGLSTASQAEMEAGTEVALRAMSPLRIAQAIAALGTTVSVKFGTLTRDVSLTTPQDTTGLGFDPIGIIIFTHVIGSNLRACWGMSDFTSQGVMIDDTGTSADTYNLSISNIVFLRNTNTTESLAVVSQITDGFRLTWSKTGSPTGTARLFYIAWGSV